MLTLPVRGRTTCVALAIALPAVAFPQTPTPAPPPTPPVSIDAPDTSPAVGCSDPSGCVEQATGLRWALARNGEIPNGAYQAGRVGTAADPIPVHLCRAYFRTAAGQVRVPGSTIPGSRVPGCIVLGWSGGSTVVAAQSYDVLMAIPPGVGWVRRGVPVSGTPVQGISTRGTCRHVMPNGQTLAGGMLTVRGCMLVYGGERRMFDAYDVLESGIPVVAQQTAPPAPVQSARPEPPPPVELALGHAMIVEIPGRDVFPQMFRPRKVQFTLVKRMRVSISAWEQPGGPRPSIRMIHDGRELHAGREFNRPMAELLLPELGAGTYEFEVSEVSEYAAPSRAVRVAVIPTTWDVPNREVMIDLVNHPGADRGATVGYAASGGMAVAVTVRAPAAVMAGLSRIVLVAPDGSELASGPPPSVSLASVPSVYTSALHHVRIERSSDVTGPVIVQTIAERVDVAAANPAPVPPDTTSSGGAPAVPAGPGRDGPPTALASVGVGEHLQAEFDSSTAQLYERIPTQFYRIPCERGALLVVDIESSANAAAVLTRAGRKVTQDDDGGRGTNARMFHDCRDNEEHLVGARLYGVTRGSFSVSVGRMSQPVVPPTASDHVLVAGRTMNVNLSEGAGTFRGYPAKSYAFLCPSSGAARFTATSSQGRQMQITIFEPDGISRSQISGAAVFRCEVGGGLYRVVVQGDNVSSLLMVPMQ